MALTAKQERFVAEYMVDLNATQAAIRAGYSEKTAGATGHENLKKPEIAKAIEGARQKAQDRLQYTADEWRRDTIKFRNEAHQQADTANTLKAQDMLGKSLGIYTEGRDLKSTDGSMTAKPTTIIFNGVDVDDAKD